MATQEYAQDPNGEMGMEEEEGVIMAPMLVSKLQVSIASMPLTALHLTPIYFSLGRKQESRHQTPRSSQMPDSTRLKRLPLRRRRRYVPSRG
jgi:hypothetical protein